MNTFAEAHAKRVSYAEAAGILMTRDRVFAGLGPISEGLCGRGLNRLIEGVCHSIRGGRDGTGQS